MAPADLFLLSLEWASHVHVPDPAGEAGAVQQTVWQYFSMPEPQWSEQSGGDWGFRQERLSCIVRRELFFCTGICWLTTEGGIEGQ